MVSSLRAGKICFGFCLLFLRVGVWIADIFVFFGRDRSIAIVSKGWVSYLFQDVLHFVFIEPIVKRVTAGTLQTSSVAITVYREGFTWGGESISSNVCMVRGQPFSVNCMSP